MSWLFFLGLAGITSLSQTLFAAEKVEPVDKASFEATYTKHEYRIPMRDGVKLFTVAFTPKDTVTNYPILLQRTPYNLKPYTVDAGDKPDGLPDSYVREKFIFALQDVRGRFASEGEFVDVRPHKPVKNGPKDTDESTDTYDTIDWLVKNVRGHNGKVGMLGISYPGFYTAAGMIDSHPALKAVSPQAPCGLVHGDDIHHNGGLFPVPELRLLHFFGQKPEDPTREEPRAIRFQNAGWLRLLPAARPTGERRREALQGKDRLLERADGAHTYDASGRPNAISHLTSRTSARRHDGRRLVRCRGSVRQRLKTYRWTERSNPGITNVLVMGPWAHGAGAGLRRQARRRQLSRQNRRVLPQKIELPFFRRFLKGATPTCHCHRSAMSSRPGADQWRRY